MKKSKKEQIIEKAMELFFMNGVHATSMDDIAVHVPAAKMTIYKYFNSKEGLLSEVLDAYIRRQHHLFRSFIGNHQDPLAAILAALDYKQENIPERFIKELLQDHPEFTTRLMSYYKQHIAREFERLIFEAQQQGQIRKDIAPHILMLYAQAIKEYLARPDILQEISDFHIIGQHFRTMFLYGIVTPEYQEKLDSPAET